MTAYDQALLPVHDVGMELNLSCLPDESVHVLEFGGKDLDVFTAVSPVTLHIEDILSGMEEGVSMLPIEAAEEICQGPQSFYQPQGQYE
jgi:hypothetical protein